MKRRDFFKKTVGVGIAAAVAPLLVQKPRTATQMFFARPHYKTALGFKISPNMMVDVEQHEKMLKMTGALRESFVKEVERNAYRRLFHA